jgi:Flp pilus assembly protein TadG
MLAAEVARLRVQAGPGTPASSTASRKGAVTIEFAIVAILLTTLVAGTFEVCRAIMVREALTDAARKACRLGVQGGQTNTTLTSDISTTLSENGLSGSNATVTIMVDGVAADVSTATARVSRLSIQVSMPSSKVYWTTNVLLAGMTIQSQTVVMLQEQ